MQQMIFIADLIACSTCFGHHYAHYQELESIIQKVCGLLLQPANRTHNPHLHTIPTKNQSTKYHRQQPFVKYSRAPDDGHNVARNMLSKQ